MSTNSAAKNREDARRTDGTFGHQHRDEPASGLPSSYSSGATPPPEIKEILGIRTTSERVELVYRLAEMTGSPDIAATGARFAHYGGPSTQGAAHEAAEVGNMAASRFLNRELSEKYGTDLEVTFTVEEGGPGLNDILEIHIRKGNTFVGSSRRGAPGTSTIPGTGAKAAVGYLERVVADTYGAAQWFEGDRLHLAHVCGRSKDWCDSCAPEPPF